MELLAGIEFDVFNEKPFNIEGFTDLYKYLDLKIWYKKLNSYINQ